MFCSNGIRHAIPTDDMYRPLISKDCGVRRVRMADGNSDQERCENGNSRNPVEPQEKHFQFLLLYSGICRISENRTFIHYYSQAHFDPRFITVILEQ